MGTQAMDAWRQSQLDEGKKKIRADMEANGELDGLTEQPIDDKIAGSAQYKEVDKEYGVGSDFWRNGTALTGLLAGALGGNVTGGMAAGAAPYVAGLIKSVTDGHESARIALHTLASAVLVQLQGGNAAAGAAGGFIAASSSEALSLAFYNKEPDKLSPDEKTVIVNLVAALGAAGGSVAAGNSSDIGGGANAARVEVENNTFLISLHPDAYQDEFKKTGDPLYRLTDKYEQEVREHVEAGDPVAIQELHNLEEAKENAKTAIALYGVLAGGSTALAATPELIALVRATASSCAGNPVLCANEVSIWIAEMAVGDALPAGLATAMVSKMSVAELSELKALMAVDKQSGNRLTAESLESFVGNTAKNGQLPTSTVEQTIANSVVDPKKFDYLFGKATGSDHTLDRTNQLALEMKRLGVTDDINGYALLAEHFTQATKNPNNIVKKYTDQYGSFEVRQSFFIDPSGKATMFESTFEVTKDGAYRFITTIPKNGVTK
ncbi:VENN motif pre-toxin domain-containing protein [Kosakonia radicincitans]|uniref:VENN motif pre-toxin domain-containing protein n=1 Tax=Kosakonia radicincitans TaxID=283686 RepID=UPI0009E083E6|nr:VENN motif pre-toxin domain-containing protein [Kosakonia radicincitans]